MTISPFEVYLVLQMDDINVGLGIALLTSIVCAVVYTIFIVHEYDGDMKVYKLPFIAPALLLAMFSLTPSTKTLAAMFIVPPLVNEGLPVVTEEARELYGLARRALEEAIDQPEPQRDQPAPTTTTE